MKYFDYGMKHLAKENVMAIAPTIHKSFVTTTRGLRRDIPFAFSYDDVNAFGQGQYQKRMARIEKARDKTLEEIYKSENALIQANQE